MNDYEWVALETPQLVDLVVDMMRHFHQHRSTPPRARNPFYAAAASPYQTKWQRFWREPSAE